MPDRVRRARAGDVDAVCEVLAEAFGDYAWTRWTVDAGDHATRIESLQRLIVERVALPYGEVWIAEDDHGVASTAIWMLPTSSVPASVWEAIAPAQTALEGDRHEASALAEATVAHLRPLDPHYYLGAVGTRSDRQGRGHASAVLAPILERADTEKAIAFLETSAASNVSFYERLGFLVTGEVDVSGGGPHVWAMTRAARERTAR